MHTAPRETQRDLGKKIKIYLSTQRRRSGQLTWGTELLVMTFLAVISAFVKGVFYRSPSCIFGFSRPDTSLILSLAAAQSCRRASVGTRDQE